MSGAPAVDLDALRGFLRKAGVEEVMVPMMEAYLQAAPGRIEALREGVRRGSGSGVAEAAHALRSAAGNLRAHRLATLLERMEQAGGAGRVDEARALLDELVGEHGRVVAILRAEIERSG